ncbi:uncharacterized protein LOC116345916 [Contarinia nasturtii]|uniref:uncharacterized protein LOC116345916 n=1 Tax=Contarinia nasturtii TaxID=265458 RepID=UPI0012D4A5FD|nr:uncharacterized protein LOC116345916 [Contarinia nasturtii]
MKLEGFAYFCLRAAGILIGGLAVIYIICHNKISDNDDGFMYTKDSPVERLTKWKLVGLSVYACWIYGIETRKPNFMLVTLVFWIFALLWTIANFFYSFTPIAFGVNKSDENVTQKRTESILTAVGFAILFGIHYLVYKLMKSSIGDRTQESDGEIVNEEKSLIINP